MNNEIERPAHYDFGQMEAREIIELAIADFRDPTTVYHVASALKYLLRASRKNGADDIAKARKHVGWAEDAARAHGVRNRVLRAEDCPVGTPQYTFTGDVQFWHGDIDKVCGIRDAGEFTQPPNCVHESTKSTNVGHVEIVDSKHPMAAEGLRLADEQPCNPPRRSESAWGVSARKTGESAWEITLPLVTTKSAAAAHARQELIEGIARMNAMAEGHAYPKLAEAQTEYQTLVGN